MSPFRALARYLLAMGGALAGLCIASQLAQGMDYAGASDASAVQRGLALYGAYLRGLAIQLVCLVAIEAVGLTLLSGGLLVLGRSVLFGRWSFTRLVALSLLVVTAFVGAEAHRYPGLFLSFLSSGWLGVAWVQMGRAVWILVLLGSAIGFGLAAKRAKRAPSRWLCSSASALVLISMAWTRGWLVHRASIGQADWEAQAQASSSPRRDGHPDPRRSAHPNILVIAVDSLRPDKISAKTTPTLARLLAQSIYFPNALVTLPRTGPSWVALLTSLSPLENGIETMFPGRARSDLSTRAMPAHLASVGYATGVFSEYAGEFFNRVRVGFDENAVPQVELRQMLGQALLARQPAALALAAQLYTSGPSVRGWLPASLRELLRGTAAFAHPRVLEDDFVGWIGSLRAAALASGADALAASANASGANALAANALAASANALAASANASGASANASGANALAASANALAATAIATERTMASSDAPWFALVFYSQPHFPYTASSPFNESLVPGADPSLRFGKDVLRGEVRTDADRAQIDALYRGALAETDAAVAALLERLDRMGELSDTLIVVTADHGEGLYECPRCAGHGDNLNGLSTLRVPLAFRLPIGRFASTPAVIETFVSQLDVYPTLLSLLDLPIPPTQEGKPLLDARGTPTSSTRDRARTFFAETGEWLWPSAAVPEDRVAYPPITQIGTLEGDRIAIAETYMPVVRAAKYRMAIRPPFALVYEPRRAGIAVRLCDLNVDPFAEADVSESYPELKALLLDELRRSVLRSASMLEVDGYFLTRPAMPPEEYW